MPLFGLIHARTGRAGHSSGFSRSPRTASMLGGGLYQFGDRVFSNFAGMVRQ